MASVQLATKKPDFNICAKKLQNIYLVTEKETFQRNTYFT